MRPLGRLLAVTSLLAAVAAPAGATTLVTSRLATTATDFEFCSVVNASSKSTSVTATMVKFDGSVIKEETLALNGFASSSVTNPGGETFYCRFSGKFSKGSVRASATVSSAGHTIVTVPAQ